MPDPCTHENNSLDVNTANCKKLVRIEVKAYGKDEYL